MEIVISMAIFFVVVTAIYIAVTLFLPEWVGITGNKAKEVMKEQQGDTTIDSTQAPAPGTTKNHQS